MLALLVSLVLGAAPDPNAEKQAAADIESVDRKVALRGLARAKKACEAQSMTACAIYARALRRLSDRPEDEPKAAALAKQSCDANVADGCAEYAYVLLIGYGVAANPLEGTSRLQELCNDQIAVACANLAFAVLTVREFEDELALSRSLAEKACALGSDDGCLMVAESLQGGSDADQRRSREMLEAACAKGRWCFQLAYSVESGYGSPADLPRALALYEKECAANDMHACVAVIAMVEEGRGTKADAVRGKKLFRDLLGRCGYECGDLQMFYRYHSPPTKDGVARADQLLKVACKAGNAESCDLLKPD